MPIISSIIRMVTKRSSSISRFYNFQPPVNSVSSSFWTLNKRHFSSEPSQTAAKTNPSESKKVKVIFKRLSGEAIEVHGKIGDTLLDLVVNHNVDIDGFGACEGTLSCSTCHLILKQEDFDKIKEKPTDEELDMLDLAYGLTDTLGCQIFLTQELDGLEVQIPEGINDQRIEPS